MPTPLDHEFVRSAARAADRWVAAETEPEGATHRVLARRVKTLVAAYRSPDSALHGNGQAVLAALAHLRALRAAQTGTGLFAGGDNVQSPPDSAFTVNDVCDAYVLAAGAGPELREIAEALAEIAGAWWAVPTRPPGTVSTSADMARRDCASHCAPTTPPA